MGFRNLLLGPMSSQLPSQTPVSGEKPATRMLLNAGCVPCMHPTYPSCPGRNMVSVMQTLKVSAAKDPEHCKNSGLLQNRAEGL